MKNKTHLTIFLIFFSVHSVFAQKLTIGIENGINFSNSRNYLSQSTPSQSGPVNGIFAKFDIGKWLLIQSGINHTNYYYKSLSNPDPFYPKSALILTSNNLKSGGNWYASKSWNNNFLRVPLLLKFKTPGKLSFEMGGGAYYAFLTNDEFTGKDKEIYYDEEEDDLMPSNDWGWILATSVTYTINDRFSVFANGQTTYGQKDFPKDSNKKNGSTELTFGIGYKPFSSKKVKQSTDTVRHKIQLIPHAGINIAKTKSSKDNENYQSSVAFASGLSIEFNLSDEVKLLSGVWYERKGHSLKYNGSSPFIYIKPEEGENTPKMEAETRLDYLTFPLLLELVSKTKLQININLGVYYSLLQNSVVRGVRTSKYIHASEFRITDRYFNYNLERWLKTSDWGPMLGLKLQYPFFLRTAVFISVNQEWGALNLLKDTDKDGNENPFGKDIEIKNRSLAIQFGFQIPLK